MSTKVAKPHHENSNLCHIHVVSIYMVTSFWTFAKGEEAKERVVSLVYDDSGSMRNNDRWKYANYALQSLVALLDEKDKFSYVPMSKPNDPLNISLTKDKRQTEIEGIGAWKTYLNTPFSAVETAMQSIKRKPI